MPPLVEPEQATAKVEGDCAEEGVNHYVCYHLRVRELHLFQGLFVGGGWAIMNMVELLLLLLKLTLIGLLLLICFKHGLITVSDHERSSGVLHETILLQIIEMLVGGMMP